MNYALLLVTDGRRDCLERTVDSFDENVAPRPRHRVIICDDEPGDFCQWVDKRFAGWRIIHGGRRGFTRTVAAAWAYMAALPGIEFVAHWEDDFVLNQPIDLRPMALLLDRHPELMQVALRRQAVNDLEIAAGGLIEQHPDWYTDYEDGAASWIQHRVGFTTNPSLYRQSLCRDHVWPDVQHSEGIFSHQLMVDPDIAFAYWGSKEHPPWVHHIGEQRVGTGY